MTQIHNLKIKVTGYLLADNGTVEIFEGSDEKNGVVRTPLANLTQSLPPYSLASAGQESLKSDNE